MKKRNLKSAKNGICKFIICCLIFSSAVAVITVPNLINPSQTADALQSFGTNKKAENKNSNGRSVILNGSDSHSVILSVPYIDQRKKYPTGCESVSAVMALKTAGMDISVDEFIDDYLPKSDLHTENGVLYGPDPNEYFIGDPRSSYSYGCYSGAIKSAAQNFMRDRGICIDESGKSLDSLCEKYVKNGTPVIIWASMDMKKTRHSTAWTLPDGSEFVWTSGEHCLVLTGYDDNNYYFNDPLKGKNVGYDKQTVQARYKELFCQALVISAK